MRCPRIDMGGIFVREKEYAERQSETVKRHAEMSRNARMRICMIEGYKEMSHINLGLANSALSADNGVLAQCEQKLAECE